MTIGIYKITSPSNKVYIGQSINIESRWKTGHKHYEKTRKKGNKLYNSYNKYGFENHKLEIIEECDVENLSDRENYFIEFYNSYNKGLNSLPTAGLSGYKDLLWKQKHRDGIMGRKGYWEGKKRPEHCLHLKNVGCGLEYERTEEHKLNISNIMINLWENRSEEKKKEIGKKISEGKKDQGCKSVICIETGQVFKSLTECSKVLNLSINNICQFCRGIYKFPTVNGYTFKYNTIL